MSAGRAAAREGVGGEVLPKPRKCVQSSLTSVDLKSLLGPIRKKTLAMALPVGSHLSQYLKFLLYHSLISFGVGTALL